MTTAISTFMSKRVTLLEEELSVAIEAMKPALAAKKKISETYAVHKSEASRLWKSGDKAGWLTEKTIRDEQLIELKAANLAVNLAKDDNAKIVLKINKAMDAYERRNDLVDEYDEETLGNAIKTISFPDDSPEWHAQRAKGVGGSDIGAIMGVSPFSKREDIFNLKTGQTKPAEKSTTGGALYRGSAWEPYIARQFAQKNPEVRLVHCKDSWQNKEREHQLVNVDGLVYENGSTVPTAVLEIKTSSVAKSWLNGVPDYYRLQTLWYMDAIGLRKAYVVVLIDDHDYQQFEIVATEEEIAHMHAEVDKFVAEVAEYKAAENGLLAV